MYVFCLAHLLVYSNSLIPLPNLHLHCSCVCMVVAMCTIPVKYLLKYQNRGMLTNATVDIISTYAQFNYYC